jgi:kanamycin kinase
MAHYRHGSDGPETLALKLRGSRRFRSVSLASFAWLERRLGVRAGLVDEVADLVDRVSRSWPDHAASLGATTRCATRSPKASGPTAARCSERATDGLPRPPVRVASVDVLPVDPSLTARYRDHAWAPVTVGESGARVFRLDPPRSAAGGGLYVKITPRTGHPDPGLDVRAEVDRLRWLSAQGIPVPEVVDTGTTGDGGAWMVTRAAAGRSAAEPWPEHRRAAVVDAVADMARALHALPAASCPFDRSLRVAVAHARRAAAAGLVDLDDLDPERRGWTAERLLAELDATLPETEDLVVCHGDYCLPNVLLDPDTCAVTALVDVGRLGLADRYADLALAVRSLASHPRNAQFGPPYAERFLARYGAHPPDHRRVAFYQLLDELF